MRTTICLLTGALLCLSCGTGCARRQQVATFTPASHELPNLLREDERTVQASVGVQSDDRGPLFVLVPEFPDPGPTPEERAILGEEREDDGLLTFPELTPVGEGTLYPYSEGVVVRHAAGNGGAAIGIGRPKEPIGVGAPTFTTRNYYPYPVRSFGIGQASTPAVGVGPVSKVEVGYGPRSSVSGHHRRRHP